MVNLYVSWLGTTLLSFHDPIDLSSPGTKIDRELSGFGPYDYVCAIAVQFPKAADGHRESIDEWQARVHDDLDAKIAIRIQDSDGTDVLVHEGRLSQWTFTNSSEVDGHDAEVYVSDPRFDAKPFRRYRLSVVVLEPAKSPAGYASQFAMEGGDPGYFFLVRPLYNVFAAILLSIFAVISAIYRRILRRRRLREGLAAAAAP